jgi:hypothetical protein
MSAGIGLVLGPASARKGRLLDMSRFSEKVVQPVLGAGTTAKALQLEGFARVVDQFLLRAHPPARLKASEAAELLGFHEDDMATLVREELLTPLGEPSHNAVKYYSLADVEALGGCHERLSAATKAIYERNKGKSRGVCAQDSADDFLICELAVGAN